MQETPVVHVTKVSGINSRLLPTRGFTRITEHGIAADGDFEMIDLNLDVWQRQTTAASLVGSWRIETDERRSFGECISFVHGQFQRAPFGDQCRRHNTSAYRDEVHEWRFPALFDGIHE